MRFLGLVRATKAHDTILANQKEEIHPMDMRTSPQHRFTGGAVVWFLLRQRYMSCFLRLSHLRENTY